MTYFSQVERSKRFGGNPDKGRPGGDLKLAGDFGSSGGFGKDGPGIFQLGWYFRLPAEKFGPRPPKSGPKGLRSRFFLGWPRNLKCSKLNIRLCVTSTVTSGAVSGRADARPCFLWTFYKMAGAKTGWVDRQQFWVNLPICVKSHFLAHFFDTKWGFGLVSKKLVQKVKIFLGKKIDKKVMCKARKMRESVCHVLFTFYQKRRQIDLRRRF